jgi:hypothetical protein
MFCFFVFNAHYFFAHKTLPHIRSKKLHTPKAPKKCDIKIFENGSNLTVKEFFLACATHNTNNTQKIRCRSNLTRVLFFAFEVRCFFLVQHATSHRAKQALDQEKQNRVIPLFVFSAIIFGEMITKGLDKKFKHLFTHNHKTTNTQNCKTTFEGG